MPQDEENILLILSSPSGAGKTTLLQKKFNKNTTVSRFQFLTPLDLQGIMKLDGVDYHFVNKEKFKELIKEKFL